jgi:hypothetical protein
MDSSRSMHRASQLVLRALLFIIVTALLFLRQLKRMCCMLLDELGECLHDRSNCAICCTSDEANVKNVARSMSSFQGQRCWHHYMDCMCMHVLADAPYLKAAIASVERNRLCALASWEEHQRREALDEEKPT